MKRKNMSYKTFTKESGINLSCKQYQILSVNPKILETMADWYRVNIVNAQAHYRFKESIDIEDLNDTVKKIEFASDGETLYMIYRGDRKKRRIIYNSDEEDDDNNTQESMIEIESSKRIEEKEEEA